MATLFLTYESASVKLENWGDGRATLTSLYSEERKLGHAKQLLRMVTNYADAHDLVLILEVGSDEQPDSLTNEQLFVFYGKFGFIPMTKGSNILSRPLVE